MIAIRRASTVRWRPAELWTLLAECSDLPDESTSWSSRVEPGPHGTRHHERFLLEDDARHYEFEIVHGVTGRRCLREAITVWPHGDGSLVELTGEAPNDEIAGWLDELFTTTLQSLGTLDEPPNGD